jgi:hypothetical protein
MRRTFWIITLISTLLLAACRGQGQVGLATPAPTSSPTVFSQPWQVYTPAAGKGVLADPFVDPDTGAQVQVLALATTSHAYTLSTFEDCSNCNHYTDKPSNLNQAILASGDDIGDYPQSVGDFTYFNSSTNDPMSGALPPFSVFAAQVQVSAPANSTAAVQDPLSNSRQSTWRPLRAQFLTGYFDQGNPSLTSPYTLYLGCRTMTTDPGNLTGGWYADPESTIQPGATRTGWLLCMGPAVAIDKMQLVWIPQNVQWSSTCSDLENLIGWRTCYLGTSSSTPIAVDAWVPGQMLGPDQAALVDYPIQDYAQNSSIPLVPHAPLQISFGSAQQSTDQGLRYASLNYSVTGPEGQSLQITADESIGWYNLDFSVSAVEANGQETVQDPSCFAILIPDAGSTRACAIPIDTTELKVELVARGWPQAGTEEKMVWVLPTPVENPLASAHTISGADVRKILPNLTFDLQEYYADNQQFPLLCPGDTYGNSVFQSAYIAPRLYFWDKSNSHTRDYLIENVPTLVITLTLPDQAAGSGGYWLLYYPGIQQNGVAGERQSVMKFRDGYIANAVEDAPSGGVVTLTFYPIDGLDLSQTLIVNSNNQGVFWRPVCGN